MSANKIKAANNKGTEVHRLEGGQVSVDEESPKIQAYAQIVALFQSNQESEESLQYLISILLKNNFGYDSSHEDSDKIKIEVVKRSNDMRVFTFRITVGPLSRLTNMLLINYSLENCQDIIGKGNFGVVSKVKLREGLFVFKYFRLEDNSDILFYALLQYFYFSVADALEAGPKMKEGIDLYFSGAEVGFLMEKCVQVDRQTQIGHDVITGLLRLHTLRIVHRDIKPENVMFSPTRKKYCLIDFGMAKLLEQKLGKLTYTSFAGTYSYSSQQLKKLHDLNASGLVDLYFSDMYALNLTNQSCLSRNYDIFVESETKTQIERLELKEAIFYAGQFMYALYFQEEKLLQSCIEANYKMKTFFYIYFINYCNTELKMVPKDHPNYIMYKKQQEQNDEKLIELNMILSKVFNSQDEQNARNAMSLIEKILKVRSMDQDKKVQLKKLRDLEDDIINGKNKIGQIQLMRSLLTAIHDYPFSFTHEKRRHFVESVARDILPNLQQKECFGFKLYKLFREMQTVFKKEKDFEYLQKIKFYYFLMNFSYEFSDLSNFLIETTTNDIDFMQRVALDIIFIQDFQHTGKSNLKTQLFEAKFDHYLTKALKIASSSKDQQVIEINHILALLIDLQTQIMDSRQPEIIVSILEKLLNKREDSVVSSVFLRKFSDCLGIITNQTFRMYRFQSIQVEKNYKFYHFEEETYSNLMIAYQYGKKDNFKQIINMAEENPFVKLYQPCLLIEPLFSNKKFNEAKTMIKSYFMLNRFSLEAYCSLDECLQFWQFYHTPQEELWRIKVDFSLRFCELSTALFSKPKLDDELQYLVLKLLMQKIVEIDMILLSNPSFEIDAEKLRKNLLQKIIQISKCEHNNLSAQKIIHVLSIYLSQKINTTTIAVILQVIDQKQIQQSFSVILLMLLSKIWRIINKTGLQLTNEVLIRKKVIEYSLFLIRRNNLRAIVELPWDIFCECLALEKMHIEFLECLAKRFDNLTFSTYDQLQKYLHEYFQDMPIDRYVLLKDHFLVSESLQSIRRHSRFGLFILQIYWNLKNQLSHKERRRLYLLCYLCYHQRQTAQNNIPQFLIGQWKYVVPITKKRKKIIWARSLARNSMNIRKVHQYIERRAKKIKRQEVEFYLKKKGEKIIKKKKQ